MVDKMGNSDSVAALETFCLDYLAYRAMAKATHSAREVSLGRKEIIQTQAIRVRAILDAWYAEIPRTQSENQAIRRTLHSLVAALGGVTQ